jgi:hypothetical protein
MFWKALAVLLAAASLSAQRGGGLMGARETPPEIGQAQTTFEQFVSRLGLDQRTQLPAAQEVFTAAAQQAAPLNPQMEQLRIRLVNAELARLRTQAGADADQQQVLKAYTAAAAEMARIEAQAFGKVYASIKPDQHERAAEAFAIIAGIFVPSPPAPPRRK